MIRELLDWLAEHWDQPEEGIWTTCDGRQDFTCGRLMCWVAFAAASGGPPRTDGLRPASSHHTTGLQGSEGTFSLCSCSWRNHLPGQEPLAELVSSAHARPFGTAALTPGGRCTGARSGHR